MRPLFNFDIKSRLLLLDFCFLQQIKAEYLYFYDNFVCDITDIAIPLDEIRFAENSRRFDSIWRFRRSHVSVAKKQELIFRRP